MSVTIIQRNKKYEQLLPNISGWHLYGLVNAVSGALIYLERGDFAFPRPPDKLSKADSVSAADLIERNLLGEDGYCDMLMKSLERQARGLYSGDLEELVKNYADWLRNCGGYRLC